MSAILRVEDLVAGHGKIDVLHGISIELGEGRLCAIVGANGAGKTSLLRAISGLVSKRSGTITFGGHDITKAAPHRIARAGLAHVPEGRRMLAHLSVEENLLVAGERHGTRSARRAAEELYDRFPILAERRFIAAGSLSGGEQQLVAIARALIAKPRAMLLDEPSMGLAPKLVNTIFNLIADERRRGASILLVEQNARKALAIADDAYVIERGMITLRGSGAELAAREDVVASYLG